MRRLPITPNLRIYVPFGGTADIGSGLGRIGSAAYDPKPKSLGEPAWRLCKNLSTLAWQMRRPVPLHALLKLG